MITPADATISEYNALLAREFGQHIRVTFILDNIVFTDEDFDIQNQCRLTTYMNPEIDLTFGVAFMSEMAVNFLRSSKTDRLNWTQEFKVEFGVEDEGEDDIKWIQVGIFAGKRPMSNTARSIEFTAYDRMQRFEKKIDDFMSLITYPCTLQSIYEKLCSFVGLNYAAGDEIADIMNRQITSAFNTDNILTCRELLAKIAEATACYARITNEGKVQLVWFDDCSSDCSLMRDNIFSLDATDLTQISGKRWGELSNTTWNGMAVYQWKDLFDKGLPLVIQGITASWTDPEESYTQPPDVDQGARRPWKEVEKSKWNSLSAYTWDNLEFMGWKGNLYNIVDNPFIHYSTEADIRAHLQIMVNRLTAFNLYYVATITAVGNWLLETGDVINLELEDGSYVKYPIFSRTIAWNGYCECEYESTGNLTRGEV